MQDNLHSGNFKAVKLDELANEIEKYSLKNVQENFQSPEINSYDNNENLDPIMKHCGTKATLATKHGEDQHVTYRI